MKSETERDIADLQVPKGWASRRDDWKRVLNESKAWKAVREKYGNGELVIMELLEVIEAEIKRIDADAQPNAAEGK